MLPSSFPCPFPFPFLSFPFPSSPPFRFPSQGGGCDPYFDVRVRNAEGKAVKVFDYKDAVKKVKNYMPRDKIVDLDCSDFDIRFAGDVRLLFWDYDRMSPPDKV